MAVIRPMFRFLCSHRTVIFYRMEGPLGREPNMYTNYQTYSLTATKTQSKPHRVDV